MLIVEEIKTYSELIKIPTFEKRFEYLKLKGEVGYDTFGYDRYLNQVFYKSYEWQKIRKEIILRDDGCDLACDDHPIFGKVLIHHLNPINYQDLVDRNPALIDPENLITISHLTHNAIHYGDSSYLTLGAIIDRKPNDTIPWRL